MLRKFTLKRKQNEIMTIFAPEIIKSLVTMRKLHVILSASLIVLAASCGKDPKPAAPMTPTQVQEKLSATAVDVMNELSPENWKEFGQTGLKLLTELKVTKGGNMKELGKDLEELFITETVDPTTKFETTVSLIKLSLMTGDITIKDGAFNYAKSNNPLNLTMVYDGKTYKAQMESTGESSTPITFLEDEDEDSSNSGKIYVPQKAAIHITENGNLFMDLSIYPVVDDKNNNGALDPEDVISGSAYLQIPAYSLNFTDLYFSATELKGKMELMHGNTSVLYMDGDLEYIITFEEPDIKASIISKIMKQVTLDEAEINKLSLMGGEAILEAEADVQDMLKVNPSPKATEAEAKAAALAINNAIKVSLRFDNNPTVQSSLVAMVVDNGEEKGNERYSIDPGLHFYDGSADMTVKEFFNIADEAFEPMVSKAATFLTKLTTYFHDLLQEFKDAGKDK